MSKTIKVTIDFTHQEVVYVNTDPDQAKREVIAIIVFENEILYRVSANGEEIDFYGFQLSKEKNVI